MPTSRRQRLTPAPPGPDWLERLKAAVFAVYPEVDHDAQLGDEPVICRRSLLALGDTVRYHETYLDPRTYEIKRAWYLDLQSAAFVGALSPTLFHTHAALVLQAIGERIKGLSAPPKQPVMSHERFVEWVTGRGVR